MSPSWSKPDPALVDRFRAALPTTSVGTERLMFGYPAYFVNDNFAIGLHGDSVVARLPGELHERVPALADAEGFDPQDTGRPLAGWYRVPAGITDDDAQLAALIAAVVTEVATLPPKPPRKVR